MVARVGATVETSEQASAGEQSDGERALARLGSDR